MVAMRRQPDSTANKTDGRTLPDRRGLRLVSPARRARRDALPENTHYADTGCEVHHSCLTCPLVRCRHDEPGGARKLLNDERDRTIVVLRGQGVAIEEIARRFGVSRRTVFRSLHAGSGHGHPVHGRRA